MYFSNISALSADQREQLVARAIGVVDGEVTGLDVQLCGVLLLPSSWGEHVLPYLPSNAGAAVFTAQPSSDSLSAGGGATALVLWLVVAVAGLTLTRRDV